MTNLIYRVAPRGLLYTRSVNHKCHWYVFTPPHTAFKMPPQKIGLLHLISSYINRILNRFFRPAKNYIQRLQRPINRASESSKQSKLSQRMPAGAWDCHMHVTSPAYPLAANAAYKPSLHSLQHAMNFESTIGISNIVLVQPSIYGNDNSCLLDALQAIGPKHGRGVVGIDPERVDLSTLQTWHKLGVRGVRLNLLSTNVKFTEESLQRLLKRYADVARPLDWVLELFIAMEHIPILERTAESLGVRLVIAHCGAPKLPALDKRLHPLDPYDLDGFKSLINLLKGGNTWIKLSATYRFDQDPEMLGIEPIARELLREAGKKIVFASDWPHTRYEGLDVRPFVDRCMQWTDAAGLTEEVFSLNAQELWQ